MPEFISAQQAARLSELSAADALAELERGTLISQAAAIDLAQHSLALVDTDPSAAHRILALSYTLYSMTGEATAVLPWLRYAQARHELLDGDSASAETNLVDANRIWTELGETAAAARTGLGMTQLLAMQGRFDEAEEAVGAAIAALETLTPRDGVQELLLLDARQNQATLYSYQERHADALVIHDAIRSDVTRLLAGPIDDEMRAELRGRLGQLGIDRALSEMHLDQPLRAAETLREAIDLLTDADARYDRGRAHTNLGHLYTRTGQVADALAEFDAATLDILGTADVDAAIDRWDPADVLFLEQAIAYLSLNLLPEATTSLARAIALFERSEQSYELGQARLYRALVALGDGDTAMAVDQLDRAAVIFTELNNHYWLNRVRIAQAAAADAAGMLDEAAAQLDALLRDASQPDATAVTAWDVISRVEIALLRVRVALRHTDVDSARRVADMAAAWLGAPDGDAQVLYPQLAFRLLHTFGQVAHAEGDIDGARRLFQQAVAVVENQRTTLPVEDFRTSFLADKGIVYADLVLSLLDEPTPQEETVAAAFAVIERARSRALLDRLLAAVNDRALLQDTEGAARGAEVRQQLAWLYNQLLGGGSESRSTTTAITDEIRTREAALQRIEWQHSLWMAEAEPASLAALQSALRTDEQALIFYLAGDEWMAFVVSAAGVRLARRLCSAAAIEKAMADLRFQLGRIEIGGEHVARHSARLLRGARTALRLLYDRLIAPLEPLLEPARRLLIIPYGVLHLTPFHALWDGTRYLVESFEIGYAPSASVELLRRRRVTPAPYTSLAAFAVREPSIPQAEVEVRAASRHFADAALYVDTAASVDALRTAAASGDVLHLATHGLFRPDNPYFSALKLADGWLDVREIYRLPLASRLVVLSACESGAVQVQGGDEAIGLVRGFLGAGAQSLVVSLWNVHDATAAQIMADFYAQVMDCGQSPAAALRAAQQNAIREERHPYFWAPYTAIG